MTFQKGHGPIFRKPVVSMVKVKETIVVEQEHKSMSMAAKFFGVAPRTVYNHCVGLVKKKTGLLFRWK